jgi:hypothetical protein
MRFVRSALLGMAVLSGPCSHSPAEAVSFFSIGIDRTSAAPEAPTFSGSGLIRFDSPANGPANDVATVDGFSLEIETIGGRFVDSGHIQVPRRFVYGLADILSVSDLVAGQMLSGVIELAPGKVSEDGGVVLGGAGDTTVLDFTGGVASGFCFDAQGGEECIFGGGTSSAMEAALGSAIVPLPWTLPLLLVALGGIRLAARPLALRPSAGRR